MMAGKFPSAHPLVAFAEALVRAALNGHRRAFNQIAQQDRGTRGQGISAAAKAAARSFPRTRETASVTRGHLWNVRL